MKVDKKLIEKVASVARITLSEAEIEEYTPQISEVLKFFESIDKVDTKNVKPSFHPVDIRNHLRKDETHEPLSNKDALANTEHKKDGFFKGPGAV